MGTHKKTSQQAEPISSADAVIQFLLNLSSRHYYRCREQAINILSLRLWSSPAKEVDFWLELLAVLDQSE